MYKSLIKTFVRVICILLVAAPSLKASVSLDGDEKRDWGPSAAVLVKSGINGDEQRIDAHFTAGLDHDDIKIISDIEIHDEGFETDQEFYDDEMYHPVSKEKLTEIVESSLKSKVKSVRLTFQNISEKEQLNLLSNYITSLIKHYDKLTKIIDIQCYYFNASMEHHLGHGLSLGGIRSRLNLSEKILKEKFLAKSRWEHDELEAKKNFEEQLCKFNHFKKYFKSEID